MVKPFVGLYRGISENIQKNKDRETNERVRQSNPKYFEEFDKLYSKDGAGRVPLPYQELQPYKDLIASQVNHGRGYIPPFLIPGAAYSGPGNRLDNGPPVNFQDADSQRHDYQYTGAKTGQDIEQADNDYIKKSIDHLAEGLSGKGTYGDSLYGAIGAAGIGIKSGLSSLTRTHLYPSLPFPGNYASPSRI